MPSFIIVGYVWQILGRRGLFVPPIREQPRKSPSLNKVKINMNKRTRFGHGILTVLTTLLMIRSSLQCGIIDAFPVLQKKKYEHFF